MNIRKKLLSSDELLDEIFSYMNKIFETNEFSTTVSLLTDLGSTIVGADRASFWFWDRRNKQYWTLAALGNEKITIDEGAGIVGISISGNETVLCNEPYSHEKFNSQVDRVSGYTTKSILCIPVTNTDGDVIGAFQALNKYDENGDGGSFDEHDIKRLTMVAAFYGKTLESYLLYNEAQIDQLTGLKNRHAFYEYYRRRILPDQGNDSVYMIMTDIDHFKNVNDTYGHNTGDAILKHVSDIFHNSLMMDDEVVRWGGEEFIFILRGRTKEEAAEFAECVRSTIEGSGYEYNGDTIYITMSFGVNKYCYDRSIDENVKMIDDKLYEAKRSGRNKVIC